MSTYLCPKHRTNDHVEESLLCWAQVSSYYSNQAKPTDILDPPAWYCSEHQTSYDNCEKWKLRHSWGFRMDRPSGVDEVDRVKEQMRVPAARTPTTVTESLQPLISNTTESELPRTYALGIQIIGDTHYQRCSTTHSLERCPLLKLWLKMVGFEDPK